MKRRTYRKRDFPLNQIRRFLEPGPIVLVSSAWHRKTNIMTMGWHMMLGFSPALFACYIANTKDFQQFGAILDQYHYVPFFTFDNEPQALFKN